MRGDGIDGKETDVIEGEELFKSEEDDFNVYDFYDDLKEIFNSDNTDNNLDENLDSFLRINFNTQEKINTLYLNLGDFVESFGNNISEKDGNNIKKKLNYVLKQKSREFALEEQHKEILTFKESVRSKLQEVLENEEISELLKSDECVDLSDLLYYINSKSQSNKINELVDSLLVFIGNTEDDQNWKNFFEIFKVVSDIYIIKTLLKYCEEKLEDDDINGNKNVKDIIFMIISYSSLSISDKEQLTTTFIYQNFEKKGILQD